MAAGAGWAMAGDAARWQAVVQADALGRDLPGYDVWTEPGRGGAPAFVVKREDGGPGPYLVLVSRDPAELRAALAGCHG